MARIGSKVVPNRSGSGAQKCRSGREFDMKNAFQTRFSCRGGKSRLTPLFEICDQKTGVSSLVWTTFGCFKPYSEGQAPLKKGVLAGFPKKPDLAPRIRRLCRERLFFGCFRSTKNTRKTLNPGRELDEGSSKRGKTPGKTGFRGHRTPVFASCVQKSCVLAVFFQKFWHL